MTLESILVLMMNCCLSTPTLKSLLKHPVADGC